MTNNTRLTQRKYKMQNTNGKYLNILNKLQDSETNRQFIKKILDINHQLVKY